jgi:hypothetical protein
MADRYILRPPPTPEGMLHWTVFDQQDGMVNTYWSSEPEAQSHTDYLNERHRGALYPELEAQLRDVTAERDHFKKVVERIIGMIPEDAGACRACGRVNGLGAVRQCAETGLAVRCDPDTQEPYSDAALERVAPT